MQVPQNPKQRTQTRTLAISWPQLLSAKNKQGSIKKGKTLYFLSNIKCYFVCVTYHHMQWNNHYIFRDNWGRNMARYCTAVFINLIETTKKLIEIAMVNSKKMFELLF